MSLNTDHIKLIFGLKLKQLRQEKGFSLQDLSNISKLSMSYINEIEKGKKYPKADKISALAEALDIDYDSLVSLKLNKKLEPISKLLKSNFLTEIPFDFFGIDPANLLEMLSDAPIKLSAFINTIIKIARSYSMSVEQFYFAVLRSYQEMHNNYFPDLEEIAKDFLKKNSVSDEKVIDEFYLSNLLLDQYGISIEYFDEKDHPTLATIRSVFIPKSKKLMINKRISSDQRAFTLAREVGFLFMNIKTRPMTSSWIKVNSFEEVFNNFQASYFAGAILIKKEPLVKSLTEIFKSDKFSSKKLNEIIQKYQTTPETLLHRIFSILPDSFGIDKLFFLRFEAPIGTKDYSLTKELHLYKQHDPQESKNENYCRRWISIKILDELSSLQKKDKNQQLIDTQISNYQDAGNQYFVISIARPLNILENTNVSVSLGFEISDEASKKIGFLNDSKVTVQNVNQTCEKCSIFDCKERVAAPTILQERRHIKSMTEAIAKLS
ncbi:helix-turn-helix domain-containing protein [Lacihabitans sp. LS3-19]|uniref:helix-turn-helix domain-containing protein n=1 Tax=Lacihabitans sp. LS3-19 TaxID=2487335 RepID=UPI0020CDF2A1|nr:XRE family transcriptional regulator [Lacihabitans sp. LS3-19]MCP9768147.1 helix-turn-helix domain-containing protein [Lacihabitans sp. LS3-19]